MDTTINTWLGTFIYVGFVDGSWKQTDQGPIAGIGGFLIDENRKASFVFFGPTHQHVGWEVELSALHHVCTALRQKNDRTHKCCIATDSSILYEQLQKARVNLRSSDSSIEYLQHINSMENVHITLINRIQNNIADKLAKEGARRKDMLSGWV